MSRRTQGTNCECIEAPASSAGEDRTVTPSEGHGRKRSIVARMRALIGSSTRGSVLVEMAVTLPPVLLVITGVAAFSIALAQKLELTEAVSTGARFLAADRGDHDPCTSTYGVVDAAAPAMLNTTSIKLTITINGVASGTAGVYNPSCPGSTGQPNTNMKAGTNATILATYTCSIHAYNYTYPGCGLSTSLTEVIQ
jgi:Flp pilus assembly protein TadG